jgi:hypothetical protein
MKEPPPSGGELGRFAAIYQRRVVARLKRTKESFKPFELF